MRCANARSRHALCTVTSASAISTHCVLLPCACTGRNWNTSARQAKHARNRVRAGQCQIGVSRNTIKTWRDAHVQATPPGQHNRTHQHVRAQAGAKPPQPVQAWHSVYITTHNDRNCLCGDTQRERSSCMKMHSAKACCALWPGPHRQFRCALPGILTHLYELYR